MRTDGQQRLRTYSSDSEGSPPSQPVDVPTVPQPFNSLLSERSSISSRSSLSSSPPDADTPESRNTIVDYCYSANTLLVHSSLWQSLSECLSFICHVFVSVCVHACVLSVCLSVCILYSHTCLPFEYLIMLQQCV